MDVLTIQWGWIGGKLFGEEPPIPPEPLPTMAGGGISYDDFQKRKQKKDDEEIILFL